MNIYRRGRTTSDWSKTDSKDPENLSAHWASNNLITLDGTIDKNGERHTEIGLELEDADVISLFNALINKYQNEIDEYRNKIRELNMKLDKTHEDSEALYKILSLISYHSDKAPSRDALLGAIQVIAGHFCGDNTPLSIEWIDYNQIYGNYYKGQFYDRKDFCKLTLEKNEKP